ncbi:MAG: FkbM family methyltransferase [Desulfomonilia bacterium]|jgi:FkbM family methyltransferase|uniref:Methyltransferase, FkbM family n=1 Tax=anaerobic digester metagenome TaxID=1263854 RepID=A0A485M626_9ZZZZ|nr:FkbM family methyltransferase [Pseudomonadota bacterium]HPD20383.1 FkbM family methyltransferase [Deltaproteobacteria bacterium]HPX17159.1 FkbM family methyltransferase [Deltaproteobacteria bacterium]HRS55217.1 FkbM family methyltransferase [Desulfomonilia bacterium]HRV34855.1 FkbM family methyltransferase [Desulfomonilia bacterium]
MKQALLNSILGHIALSARDRFDLLRALLRNPESAGTIVNDWIAFSLVTKLCLPGKIFVDVGAHIGSVISEVHRNDKRVQIVAIEAIPEKAERLRRTFPFARIHQCAVGESRGKVSFFVHTLRSGYSSLSRPPEGDGAIQEIITPMDTLDNLISSPDVDVIKIDVEGAELGVIRGGKRVLSDCRPLVMFESAPSGVGSLGYTKDALWRQLDELGYQIFVPNRLAHDGDGLSLECFLDSHVYPRRTTNYFAVPEERRIEIRDRARLIRGIRPG